MALLLWCPLCYNGSIIVIVRDGGLMGEQEILLLIRDGGALVLLAFVLAKQLPAEAHRSRQINDLRAAVNHLSSELALVRKDWDEMLENQRLNMNHTILLRRAIRIAFAGRGSGQTWQDARNHYVVASQLLAEEDEDTILKELEG